MLFTFVYLHGYEEMNIVNGSVFFSDSIYDVGDFFAHKVMQIPNIETVFESELI